MVARVCNEVVRGASERRFGGSGSQPLRAPRSLVSLLLWGQHSGTLGPDGSGGGDGQHAPLAVLLHGFTQARRFSIDRVSGHLMHELAWEPGELMHGEGLFGLVVNLDLFRHFGLGSALAVPAPLLWQIELPVEKDMAGLARVTQHGRHLAVLELAGRPQ